MRTGLTRRDSTAVGLSGTALRLDVQQTNRGASSAASSSRMHPAAVSFSAGVFSRKIAGKQNGQALVQNCGRLPLWLFRRSKRPINRVGCLALLQRPPRFARFSAACGRPLFSSLRQSADVPFAQYLISAQYLFDTCLIPGVESGPGRIKSGLHQLSPIKFLIAKNPLPCRRSTRPNAPVGTVPAARYRRACNSLLRFPGEQLALGASKITVVRLHLYSLTTSGQLTGFFQTVRKLYSE